MGGPNQYDLDLVQQSIGATGDMARRQMQMASTQGQAQLGEVLSSKGQTSSSIEDVKRMLMELGFDQNVANMVNQQQIQGSQALMQLPFQRANTQMNANQLLFNQLTGSAGMNLQTQLGERLAQTTTKTEQSANPMQYIQAAASLGAMPFTGGASLAMMPSQAASQMDAVGQYQVPY